MRVAIHHHQRKAVPLAQALLDHGHELAEWPADALLIDADRPAHRPMIDRYVASGAKAFIYPHGVPMDLTHDIDDPYPAVTGQFVVGEGQAEVARRIGYRAGLYVTGWYFSPMAPWRGTGRVRDVLFAPAHPLQNGLLIPLYRQLNAETFRALLDVPDIRITVRHIQSVEANGLWPEPGVTFIQGAEDNAYQQIDATDVVVSFHGTFPCLAVARGCPTVFFGGDLRASDREHGGEPRLGRRWEAYHPYLRYPIDAADGPMAELLARAAGDEDAVRDWRRRFIGSPWDPARFVAQLERAVSDRPGPGPAALDVRGFVVVASAREVAAQPELLARYAERFGPGDDATLVLHAPGGDAGVLAEEIGIAIARAGLDEAALPDLLLEAGWAASSETTLATMAHAVLGGAAPAAWAALPRFGPEDAGDLRALADRRRADPAGS